MSPHETSDAVKACHEVPADVAEGKLLVPAVVVAVRNLIQRSIALSLTQVYLSLVRNFAYSLHLNGIMAPNATLPLQGKTALVTGSARGIGAAIAWKLATEGADVSEFFLDRTCDRRTCVS